MLNSSLTVTDIRRNYSQLQNWLYSDAAKQMETDDLASIHYWTTESEKVPSIPGDDYQNDSGFIQSYQKNMRSDLSV
jgi:hypothetical protein